MSPTPLKAERYLGISVDCCINPACGNDIRGKHRKYRKYYCSPGCYMDYPTTKAVVEKRFGKKVPELLIDLYNEGFRTEKAIAKELGVSSGTVGRWKQEYSIRQTEHYKRITVEVFEKKHKKPIREVLVTALNSFPTQQETARNLGISVATIRKWIEQFKIEQITYFE